MQITRQMNVGIPSLPNFIPCDMNGEIVMVALEEFSEAELKIVGEAWTQELIKKANKRQDNK